MVFFVTFTLDCWIFCYFLVPATSLFRRASKGMHIVQQTMNKQLPWSEEETHVIRDELKNKGFASAYCVLERQREKFHPTRTVKSLEAQFYKWKRSGGEWDQISSLQSPKCMCSLPFTHCYTHSFTHPLLHSFTHCFTHSSTYHPPTVTLIHVH